MINLIYSHQIDTEKENLITKKFDCKINVSKTFNERFDLHLLLTDIDTKESKEELLSFNGSFTNEDNLKEYLLNKKGFSVILQNEKELINA